VILFMSDLLADRLPAEPNTSRGDDHRAVIESIKDYVETVISIAVENEDSGRVQDILDRLREAMAPYNRRLARGRTARQSDIPKVVRKVHSIYDPLGVDQ
jgi:hypothetical protein